MARLLVFLLAAAPSIAAGIAHAQIPVEISGGGDVSILADRMEESGPDRLLVATGNVEITRGTTRLSADRVELNRVTGDAVASGRVIFYDGQDRLSGGRIDYNLNSGTGVIHDAAAFSAPYYRLSGERIERLEESVYKIYRGVFTTCEDDPPAWSIHLGSATADFDDFLFGRDASFWVRNIPVIPFLPFFAAALRRERQSGFLPPTFGSSTRHGTFAKIPFYWAISDSRDLTVSLDAYSKRGLGANGEYRYILSERAQGLATGFFIQESELQGDLRGFFRWRHALTADAGVSVKVDINHVSDDDLFREYDDRLFQRSLQRTNSNVFLTKRWDLWNFVGNAFWYQDLTTSHPVELQRLPDLRLVNVRQPVPGLPGVLWDFESNATHFVRQAGSEGSRVDVHARAVMPFRPLGVVTIAPFVGARSTTYDRRVTGVETRYGENLALEATEASIRTRALGEAGVDLEARASRIWEVNAGGISRVSHVIEPRLNYTFVDGVNKDRLPGWDGIDALGRTNAFSYSLTNRLLARTAASPDGQGARWELMRLTLANSFNADAGDRPLGNITGDLIIDPSRYFRLRADAALSVYEGDALRGLNSDVTLRLPDVTASVGTRYNADQKIQFVRGEATAKLSRYLTLRGSSDWDAERGVFVENRVGADIHFQCWAFALTYVAKSKASTPTTPGSDPTTDHEFRFSVDLLGLGTVGTRTAIGQ